MLLEAENISKSFGGVQAVLHMSLSVPDDGIVAIIGPNGAGKSTMFNLLSGVYAPDEGRIMLDGQDITGLEPHETNRLGLARTFQKIRLFKKLTVLHNVVIGFQPRRRISVWQVVLRRGLLNRETRETQQRAMELLEFVGLADVAHETASTLPYGRQRMLEIARAMATSPRVLLLDEPAAGLNSEEARELVGLLRRIRERGMAVVVVEHNMDLVMNVAERISVMRTGELLFAGTPDEVQQQPEVVQAYLGEEHF